MSPIAAAMTEAEPEAQRVLRGLEHVPLPPPLLHSEAHALYDKASASTVSPANFPSGRLCSQSRSASLLSFPRSS